MYSVWGLGLLAKRTIYIYMYIIYICAGVMSGHVLRLLIEPQKEKSQSRL